MVLICADMNIGEPGDFLYVSGGVDWVYASIMDGSWRLERNGAGEGWFSGWEPFVVATGR
ncbi:hypothetical protein BA950_07760 [Erythrobacter sp. SAORIC-644]|nr:hypothetical protein BA950_07760 [Erythrobacter sp. SAORIC-644]